MGVKHYFWDVTILFRQCVDQIIQRCVLEGDNGEILKHWHSLECEGHFNRQRTTAKVLQSGFYWPFLFKDAHSFAKSCDRCQRPCNDGKRNEMPFTTILEAELFDVWGLILWALSHPPMATNTYYWLWIMFQSG